MDVSRRNEAHLIWCVSWQATSPYFGHEIISSVSARHGLSCSGSNGLALIRVGTCIPRALQFFLEESSANRFPVIYYASTVFQSYGFSEGTTAELATGVTGSVFMAGTIPAMVRIRSLQGGHHLRWGNRFSQLFVM